MASPALSCLHPFFFLAFLLLYVRLCNCGEVSFDQNYYNNWGSHHFSSVNNGREVRLTIDKYSGLYSLLIAIYGGPSLQYCSLFISLSCLLTLISNAFCGSDSGSGFMSRRTYGSGFFGMRIKLPKKDTLGIITAFYLTSLANNAPGGNHDELDFEFLGSNGMPYTLQTNVFASDNGGREERVNLWFDPTESFHTYRILWNPYHIVFYVDDIAIRLFENNRKIGANYPSHAMSVVASLWSDEEWASHGKPINWSQGPFVAAYQGFEINGCAGGGNACNSDRYWWNGPNYRGLSHAESLAYFRMRRKYLTYTYCSQAGNRYPECKRRATLHH